MRALNASKKRWLLSSLLLFSLSDAKVLQEDILSKEQQESLRLSAQKVDLESKKLRDSWLNPVMMNYQASYKNQYGQDQENYQATVAVDQPIFKSGGIYFAIKYADAKAHYEKLGIVMEKRRMIKETFELVINLRRNDIAIAQAQLQLQDLENSLAFNRDQLAAGEIDPAVVYQAEIEANSMKMQIIDLQQNRRQMLYRLAIFSELDYEKIRLPQLQLVDESAYVDENIILQQAQAKIEENRQWSRVTLAKYLPSVNINASYNYSEGVNQAFSDSFSIGDIQSSYSAYGFSVSMPLFDINMLRDIESAKVDYLKSSIEMQRMKADEARFYRMTLSNYQNSVEKERLAKENYRLYKKVHDYAKDAYASGETNIVELKKSRHQLEIKSMDIQKFYLEGQLSLLALYEKFHEI